MSISKSWVSIPPCCFQALDKVKPSCSPAYKCKRKPSLCKRFRCLLFTGKSFQSPMSVTKRLLTCCGRPRKTGWLSTRSSIHFFSFSKLMLFMLFWTPTVSISSIKSKAKVLGSCGHPLRFSTGSCPRTGWTTFRVSPAHLTWHPKSWTNCPIGKIGSTSCRSVTMVPPGVTCRVVDWPFAKVTETFL